MKHVGEPVRLMSGEYGTVVVEDGDDYPEWFTAPAESDVADDGAGKDADDVGG